VGSVQEKLRVSGPGLTNAYRLTNLEAASLRFVVVQRVGKDWWIEPSVTFGITADSPDYILGMTVRRRF
jgi:hypothetical protein